LPKTNLIRPPHMRSGIPWETPAVFMKNLKFIFAFAANDTVFNWLA